MKIYDTLHADHEKVAHLFKQIEDTSAGALKTRARLFSTLKSELEIHSRAEERVFYSALKDHSDSRFGAMLASEEHHVLDLLLDEIDAMDVSDEAWLAKVCVLKENVLHHVDEEENELFPKARSFLDDEGAEEMGRRFREQKKALH